MLYDETLTIREVIRLIDQEIKWCRENPDKSPKGDYQMGFIRGLLQAKYIITEASKRLQ